MTAGDTGDGLMAMEHREAQPSRVADHQDLKPVADKEGRFPAPRLTRVLSMDENCIMKRRTDRPGNQVMTTPTINNELDAHYLLGDEQIARFEEQGFIKLKNVFSQEVLDYYGKVITASVIANNDLADVPMKKRSTYQRAFIQVMNLWRKDETVREFVFGKRLARIAADLLNVSGVRLYHDQALYKEPSGGFTPWHADQQYWPLATDRTITAWIPLHAVSMESGPVSFAAGSQQMTLGRDLEISDASEATLADALDESNFTHVEQPFELGEVSFHLGWTYHKAGPNSSTDARRIMTVIYMDEQMKLKYPENPNQQLDREAWCPGAAVGEVVDSPLNPVLFSRSMNPKLPF